MRRRASAPKRVRGARSLETAIMTRVVSARRPASGGADMRKARL
jgi:hypothetical protein